MSDLQFYLSGASLLTGAVAAIACHEQLKKLPFLKRSSEKPAPGPAPWDAAVSSLPPRPYAPPEIPSLAVPFVSAVLAGAAKDLGRLAAPPSLKARGTVYVIQDSATGLYKIGRTGNMERRMAELGVGKSARLISQHPTSDAAALESAAHRRYRNQRLPQTEYFRLSAPPTI
jgi:hypothetical protein